MTDGLTRGLFALSLLLALVLQCVLLPPQLASAGPMWVALVIGYWALYGPNAPVLLAAWLLGLSCDALLSAPLGQHALGLLLVAYSLTRLRATLGLFPLWQQTIALAPGWLLFAVLMFWLDGTAGHPSQAAARFLPVLTTSLLWPLVCWALDLLRGPGERR